MRIGCAGKGPGGKDSAMKRFIGERLKGDDVNKSDKMHIDDETLGFLPSDNVPIGNLLQASPGSPACFKPCYCSIFVLHFLVILAVQGLFSIHSYAKHCIGFIMLSLCISIISILVWYRLDANAARLLYNVIKYSTSWCCKVASGSITLVFPILLKLAGVTFLISYSFNE